MVSDIQSKYPLIFPSFPFPQKFVHNIVCFRWRWGNREMDWKGDFGFQTPLLAVIHAFLAILPLACLGWLLTVPAVSMFSPAVSRIAGSSCEGFQSSTSKGQFEFICACQFGMRLSLETYLVNLLNIYLISLFSS